VHQQKSRTTEMKKLLIILTALLVFVPILSGCVSASLEFEVGRLGSTLTWPKDADSSAYSQVSITLARGWEARDFEDGRELTALKVDSKYKDIFKANIGMSTTLGSIYDTAKGAKSEIMAIALQTRKNVDLITDDSEAREGRTWHILEYTYFEDRIDKDVTQYISFYLERKDGATYGYIFVGTVLADDTEALAQVKEMFEGVSVAGQAPSEDPLPEDTLDYDAQEDPSSKDALSWTEYGLEATITLEEGWVARDFEIGAKMTAIKESSAYTDTFIPNLELRITEREQGTTFDEAARDLYLGASAYYEDFFVWIDETRTVDGKQWYVLEFSCLDADTGINLTYCFYLRTEESGDAVYEWRLGGVAGEDDIEAILEIEAMFEGMRLTEVA
jgi:hypothetical protein